jgi:hypothetical protein
MTRQSTGWNECRCGTVGPDLGLHITGRLRANTTRLVRADQHAQSSTEPCALQGSSHYRTSELLLGSCLFVRTFCTAYPVWPVLRQVCRGLWYSPGRLARPIRLLESLVIVFQISSLPLSAFHVPFGYVVA